MKKIWDEEAWDDYLYWQTQDKKTLRRVNQLIKDIERSPYEGIGKPEQLKHNLQGFWSRRIDEIVTTENSQKHSINHQLRVF